VTCNSIACYHFLAILPCLAISETPSEFSQTFCKLQGSGV